MPVVGKLVGRIIVLVWMYCWTWSNPVMAADVVDGKVVSTRENQNGQKIEIRYTSKSGKQVTTWVDQVNDQITPPIYYKAGDLVIVEVDEMGTKIVDFQRKQALLWVGGIFLGLIILVSGFRGIGALAGMAMTFAILYFLVLPYILKGFSPVMVAFGGMALTIPVSFLLSHGWNKKSAVAMLGALLSLLITSGLASVFIGLGHLTGLSSEEAGFLAIFHQGNLNMGGILLAGIIIGALGVLDDVTVSQAAIVEEIALSTKYKTVEELYFRGMKIGRDHIASTINTLVIAYTGASLPLLLLFLNRSQSWVEMLNYEIVAEEIIRTLVGSIGLILAVPITTLIAALVYRKVR